MVKVTAVPHVPSFATHPWYSDPSDHRCPHDAWLESCEIREAAHGERGGGRTTEITIRLLGAYHDGYIALRYSGVERFVISSEAVAAGLRDWLSDRFTVTSSELIRHDITWSGQHVEDGSHWSIDARHIQYEWLPKSI